MNKDVAVVDRDTILTNLSKCVTMLRECVSAEDAKKFIDVGAAAKVWAQRQKLGIEAQNSATEFVVRAERRLGEILRQTKRNQGGRPGKKPVTLEVQVSKLNEIGISRNLSSRAQRLTKIPPEKFEAAIAQTKKERKEITYTDITTKLLTPTVDVKPITSEVDAIIARIINIIKTELSRANKEGQSKIAHALSKYTSELLSTCAANDNGIEEAQILKEANGNNNKGSRDHWIPPRLRGKGKDKTMQDAARILKFKGKELRTAADVAAAYEALYNDRIAGSVTPAEARKIGRQLREKAKQFGAVLRTLRNLKALTDLAERAKRKTT
jgi:hypothetical protein